MSERYERAGYELRNRGARDSGNGKPMRMLRSTGAGGQDGVKMDN